MSGIHPQDMVQMAPADPYEGRKGNWFQTFTGRPFFPADPRTNEIYVADIAHALSMVCRFGGHVAQFYSVAQHSLLVSLHLAPHGEIELLAQGVSESVKRAYAELLDLGLAGLLHDAAEAYIGDMTSPVKNLDELKGFKEVERRIDRAIWERFQLPFMSMTWDQVKVADRRLLFTEKRDLRPAGRVPPSLVWEDAKKYPAIEEMKIRAVDPAEAERLFLDRFHDLWKRRSGESWEEVA